MLLLEFSNLKNIFDFGSISLPKTSALLDFPITNTLDLNQLVLSLGTVAAIALTVFAITSLIEIAKPNK